MSIRCFIAMAFGHQDTDQIYSRRIFPVLKGMKITPIRVDRKEHNKNINEVIMDELKLCDLVIADLTYARPSVYFEAGYAERKVDVIYTCRGDHFEPRSNDPHGNERVHFDVSMRNIIKWSSPSDSSFVNKLERRIKHLISPIQIQLREEQSLREETKIFSALSLNEKNRLMSEMLLSHLTRNEFIKIRSDGTSFVVVKIVNSEIIFAFILRPDYLRRVRSKDKFEFDMGMFMLECKRELLKKHFSQRKLGNVKLAKIHYFVCTPEKIILKSLMQAMPHAHSIDSGKGLSWTSHNFFGWSIKEKDSPSENQPIEISIHLFDGVQSIPSLKQRFVEFFGNR